MEKSDCFSLIDENDSLISPDADDAADLTHLHSGLSLHSISHFSMHHRFLFLIYVCLYERGTLDMFNLVWFMSVLSMYL